MPNLNRCEFMGHLGRDPEIRYTQSGKAVASFSMAVSEKWGGEEHTEWINVVMWEKLAEVAGKYLQKGAPVYIAGRMQTRKWEDRDGNPRYTTEIVAREMQMLGGKGEPKPDAQKPQPQQSGKSGADCFGDNEIPF